MRRLFFLLAMITGTSQAQDFSPHRWKHRLLVIYTSELNSVVVQQQMEVFRQAEKDLKTRKLRIYVISETEFLVGFSSEVNSRSTPTKIAKPFEIVLLGLDGGEKYRSSELQEMKTFNQLIDQMPMRRQELKTKNKKN